MAIGGGGGGGGAFPLGSATVTLAAIPGNYFATMAAAQAALNSLAARGRALNLTLGGVGGRTPGLVTQVGRAFEAMTRGVGTAAGKVATGLGTGLGRASQGFGSGLGRAIGATSSPIRAIGSLLNATARGFSSILTASIRGVSTLLGTIGRTASGILARVRGLLGGAGLIGGLGGGAALLGVLREGIQRETMRTTLGRSTGLQGGALAALSGNFARMSQFMPVSFAQLSSIASMGARLGVGARDLTAWTKAVSMLSTVITDIPIEDLTSRTQRLLNVFNRAPSDALRFASALNRLDLQSSASASEILDLTTRLSGTARALKMSIPETMALATALRESGLSVEVAGTAMSQVLQKMVSAPKDFAKLAGMGRSQFQELAATDPLKALAAVMERLKGMEAGPAIKALEGLHLNGQRTRATLLQLSATFDRIPGLTEAARKEWLEASSILGFFGERAATAQAKLTVMFNNIRQAAGDLGERLLPVVTGFADGVTSLFRDLDTLVTRNGDAISAWATRVGAVLGHIGVLFRAWPQIVGIARSYVVQGLQSIADVARRVWSQLGANTEWAFTAMGQVIRNVMTGAFEFLLDLMSQYGPALAARLQNTFIGALTMIDPRVKRVLELAFPQLAILEKVGAVQEPGLQPHMALLGDPLAGVGPAPGFGNPLASLPGINRRQQAVRAGLVGQIVAARQGQQIWEAIEQAMLPGAGGGPVARLPEAPPRPLSRAARVRAARLATMHRPGRTMLGGVLGGLGGLGGLLAGPTRTRRQQAIDARVAAARARRDARRRRPALPAANLPQLDLRLPPEVADRLGPAGDQAKAVAGPIVDAVEQTRVVLDAILAAVRKPNVWAN